VRERLLVGPTELAAWMTEPRPPRILDARFRLAGPPGVDDYVSGHLPGAVFIDVERELSGAVRDDRRGGRHPLPETADVEPALRRAGVDSDTPVVCYDGGDGMGAARAWWLLRYLGHRDVRVMDGGYPGWVDAGLPTESGPGPEVPPGSFTARPGTMPTIDADAAAELAQSGLLLDVRAGERYRGEVEPLDPVAGHIPGAVSAPASQNLDERGRFRSAAELADRFRPLGADDGRPVAAYCGSGITAAHTVLALETIGIDAALYPGSWSDWVSDPARPVATGH
jgi:thiosulfate/3-mercaptopyruvate sulfurtransferase